MVKTKLEWALETQKLGLPVFPVSWTREDGSCSCGDPACQKPGKHPLSGSKGFKDATTDPSEIRKLWEETPDANIAAYPGQEYVVIDLDCKRLPNGQDVSGLTNLASHLGLDEYELLAQTYTVSTPSGGFHLYFRADSDYASGVGLIPGVDSRAVGGYVLAPGSTIHGRAYAISNPVDMETIPDSFSKFLRKIRDKAEDAHKPLFELDHPAAIDRVRTLLRERAPAISGKGGNSHTYVTVCVVKDHAVSADKCLALLLEPGGWNDRCDPPWSPKELADVIENAYEYGKDRPGSKGGSLLDMFDAPDADNVIRLDEYRNGHGDDNDPFAKFRANFYNAADFKKLKLEYDMIVPGWIPAAGFTCFLAQRGAGKTTILMDLCCRLACDMDWQGIELDKGWDICWVSGEDEGGAQIRMKAWEKKHMIEVDSNRFHMLTIPIDLNNASEVSAFAKFLHQEFKGRRVIFILDTWQRMTSSAESQSKDSDMQLALHHVEALAKSFHGPAFVAFHPPKANANTIMGSSVIENSSQAIIQITDEGNNQHRAVVTRIKGDGYGNYVDFNFEKMELDDMDRFGRPVTSVVAVKVAGTGSEQSPALRVLDQVFAEVVRDIIIHIGDIEPGRSIQNIGITYAAEVILSIPRRAQLREPHFIRWEKMLEEAGWKFGPEGKGDNSPPYKRIRNLLIDKTKEYPLDLDSYGLYLEGPKNKKVIRLRRMVGADGIDNPNEIEEPTDA